MSKFLSFKKALAIIIMIMLVINICSCAEMVSGRRYTLAKEDIHTTLVESHKVLQEQKKNAGFYQFTVDQLANYPELMRKQNQPIPADTIDTLIQPRQCIGINLNRGYMRFLQSIMRPEIAIFARTRIHDRKNPDNDFVYERVMMASENKDAQIVLNKDSSIPQIDLPILPPIEYNGEDLTVEIRVIDLHKQNNERVKQLINAAASTAATIKPEVAASVSVFQTVLTFLTNNNTDQIEFMLDLHISADSDTRTVGSAGEKFDLVMTPRVGKYVVIKTEHPERTVYPKRYFDYIPDAIRLGIAEVLKIGTLNSANFVYKRLFAAVENEESVDLYEGLLGYPYGVVKKTFTEPVFNGNGDYTLFTDYKLTKQFYLADDELYLTELPPPRKFPKKKFLCIPYALADYANVTSLSMDNYRRDDKTRTQDLAGPTYPFRDQSYLVFSIISPQTGTPMAVVREQAKAHKEIEDLGINTRQATPAEWQEQLAKVTNSVKGLALVKYIHQKYDERISKAKSPDELNKALEEQKKDLDKLDDLLTPETVGGAKTSFSKDIASVLKPELNDLYRQKVIERAIQLQSAAKRDGTETSSETGVTPSHLFVGTSQSFLISVPENPKGDKLIAQRGEMGKFDNFLTVKQISKISPTTWVFENISTKTPGDYAFFINSVSRKGGYIIPYHVIEPPKILGNYSINSITTKETKVRIATIKQDILDYVESIILRIEGAVYEFFKEAKSDGKTEFISDNNNKPVAIGFKNTTAFVYGITTTIISGERNPQNVNCKIKKVIIGMGYGLGNYSTVP